MASEAILNQKKAEVKELAEKMKNSKLILLTEYRGINVTDDTQLRKDLRNSNATCNVIKNNITRRALAECGIEGLEEQLVGPTAVIMSSEDYLAKLPSRETLLSMLAGALLSNISKVAVALNEVKKQKEEAGEKVEVAVTEEASANEEKAE